MLLLGEIDLSAGTAGGVCAGFAAQALVSGNLHKAVGAGVLHRLLVGMWSPSRSACLEPALAGRGGRRARRPAASSPASRRTTSGSRSSFALCIGVAIGVLNGVLVPRLGIPSFIVTLALFLAWEGVTLVRRQQPVDQHQQLRASGST